MGTRLYAVLGFLGSWRALLAAVAVVVALAYVDGCQKAPPEGEIAGYCPEGAPWVAACDDFGAFYGALTASDFHARLSQALPREVAALDVAVRKTIGIRPTPLRWRVWMGRQFLASWSKEGPGFCTRPGVLLRTASLAHGTLNRASNSAIRRFAGWHYAWRDGFLIASPHRAYVEAALNAPPCTGAIPLSPDELRLHPRGDKSWLLRVRPTDGLPIAGRLAGQLTNRLGPLTLTDAWSEPPLLSICAKDWRDVASVGAFLVRAAALTPPSLGLKAWLDHARDVALSVLPRWHMPTPHPDWDQSVLEWAFALTEIDATSAAPVPVAGLVMRSAQPAQGPHPLDWLAGSEVSVPYEWEGEPGLLVPWVGEDLTLCLGRHGHDWLAASREPAMAAMAGRLQEGKTVDGDLYVRLRWDRLADTLSDLARNAAGNGLITGLAPADVDQRGAPLLRALGAMGAFELRANAQSDQVVFEGMLAHAPAVAQP